MWDDESRTASMQRIGIRRKAIESVSFEAGAVTAYSNILRELSKGLEGDMAPFLKKYYQCMKRAHDCTQEPFYAGILYAIRDAASELDVAPASLSEPV